MASKKYAYFNKGNKLALIQQDTTDVTHQDYAKYKSPIETVENGIEIEYSYAPTFRDITVEIDDDGSQPSGHIGIAAWTVVDGYLTFLDTFYNWSAASLNAFLSVGKYIQIHNGEWAGIHKIKHRGDTTTDTIGGLQTETKVDIPVKYLKTEIDHAYGASVGVSGYFTGVSDKIQSFIPSVKYLHICGHSTAFNNAIYSDWTYDPDTDSGRLTPKTIHYANLYEPYYEVGSNINVMLDNAADYTLHFRECFLSPSYLSGPVEMMEDETFILDLNHYQSQAVVLYLKAKDAEDQGDIEKYEYYMTSFRKQLAKFRSAQKYGPSIIQGNRNMLK